MQILTELVAGSFTLYPINISIGAMPPMAVCVRLMLGHTDV